MPERNSHISPIHLLKMPQTEKERLLGCFYNFVIILVYCSHIDDPGLRIDF